MRTYMIAFYPGFVLPKPYYVCTEANDCQVIVDTLIDKLEELDLKIFDDAEEEAEDMIVVGGNHSRRLITGGMLSVTDITEDDYHIALLLQEKAGTDYINGLYRIGFTEDEAEKETAFFCTDARDLALWWISFCLEHDLSPVEINYVKEVE